MSFRKYSKERLLKHEYCAYIINAKKVVCKCGKTIKLNRCYTEDYLDRHVASSGCKIREGQRSIYNYFKPAKKIDDDSEDEGWNSEIYDNMDEDDLLQVDDLEEQNDNTSALININEDLSNTLQRSKKQKLICYGLQSEQISMYIQRTPAQFGGSRRIEVVARELFPRLFPVNFCQKKLNYSQKRQLNRALFAESAWYIDRTCKLILIII